MNTIQVKIFLVKAGLSLQEVARELRTENQTEQSVRVMLSQMIHGRRFYPTLASRFEERYGVRLPRPAKPEQRRAA